ncbi:MAG: hypothetical protein JOZ57_03525, partial [Abitibacteriaceae bacterium]|nr:hypothetical protein [Abditibacteriaceae bacterium]
LQPKTISTRDGILPPLFLRIANLGTVPRSFHLNARPLERNLALVQVAPISLGTVVLEPGQLKEIPVKLPLYLLGFYTLEYRAETGNETTTQQEKVSVINALDVAEGFRHWAAHRKWFSVPVRRAATGPDNKAQVEVSTADNGLSLVPLFPVQPRHARPGDVPVKPPSLMELLRQGSGFSEDRPPGSELSVLTTQLSPAWLLKSTDRQLTLFGDTRRVGLDGPSHLAFATAQGTRVLKVGTALNALDLRAMTQPWLLVWWAGSDGWQTWDVPYFVLLQHRPTSLKLNEQGVNLFFTNSADYIASMPLYGYAKLPQQSAWQKQPEMFRLPAAWPKLHTWNWEQSLPSYVTARCNWWAKALTRFPSNVHETYSIDHAAGMVHVRDQYDYINIKTDWNTVPITLAPLSPTLAVAQQGGYPMTIEKKLLDCQYPTLFGPYSAVEGSNEVRYSFNIGPYWMQTADPNLNQPADANTPARRAQAQLLNWAANNSSDAAEVQMWDWRDENFVWYMQSGDLREPAYATGYTTGTLRQDHKSWLQARVLHTLLDPTRYKMDERNGVLTRRYIDGPGIGNWGSADWGDSGKLGTDMIWDAYVYAYNTGDYQTIADKWGIIISLNTLPVTMSWLGVGRSAIAEMGDEAPPMLGLARLAYAVGDKDTYSAAVYWYARELVHHVVKEGAFTKWREQFEPWHTGLELSTETPTNLWGTNAAWQPGGFRTTSGGENQWNNFYVRFDDVDTWRFHQHYARELPKRITAIAKPEELKKNYQVYLARVAVLGDDVAKAQADYVQSDPKVNAPDNYISRVMATWREFPPKLETLIPAATPTFTDNGWAWSQMNFLSAGMVSPQQMNKGRLPTPQWFWWKPPHPQQGVEWGDKWTFGSLSPSNKAPDASATSQDLNAVSTLWSYTLHDLTTNNQLPDALYNTAQKTNFANE